MTQAEINCREGLELQYLLQMSLVCAGSPHVHIMLVQQVSGHCCRVDTVIPVSMCEARKRSLVLPETLSIFPYLLLNLMSPVAYMI